MLEFVLGLAPWNTATGRGMVNCNYRRIDEDIFGKSYGTFLAADRKDEGIYHTLAGINTVRPRSKACWKISWSV